MSVFIKGKDCTEEITNASDSAELAALFDVYQDELPIGSESITDWQQRGNNLLSAMIAHNNNPQGDVKDFYY